MTKKDFEFFCEMMVRNDWPSNVEVEMIRYLKSKNPRFDDDLWAKRRTQLQQEKRRILYDE